MKHIPLTQGQVALVDDEDYESLNKTHWYCSYSKKTRSYYARSVVGKKRRTIQMHRYIMKTPKGLVCDHINHDTLDNRKVNLRNCTYQQNGMNKRKIIKNKTRYKNIYPLNGTKKYRVSITKNYKRVFDGQYVKLKDAIKARDEALKKYHGEYANTGE